MLDNSHLPPEIALRESGRTTGREVEGSTGQSVSALPCLLCGSLRHLPIFNESGIDIMQCCQCHHVFSSFAADPHFEGFWGDDVAEGAQFYWSEARARMHHDFAKRFIVGRSGRLLDMGCGLGFFLKVVSQYPNWEACGCEISAAAVRYAREILGLRHVDRGRLDSADFADGSIDIITIWDVIDHVLQPDPFLQRCHALLKEGGICFIRTPNVSTQLLRARLKKLVWGLRPDLTYLMAHDHLHIYSAASIRKILERNGFSQIEFVHLHPISSSKGAFIRGMKKAAFEAVRTLAAVSRGRLNFDNLFVIARKESQIRA